MFIKHILIMLLEKQNIKKNILGMSSWAIVNVQFIELILSHEVYCGVHAGKTDQEGIENTMIQQRSAEQYCMVNEIMSASYRKEGGLND